MCSMTGNEISTNNHNDDNDNEGLNICSSEASAAEDPDTANNHDNSTDWLEATREVQVSAQSQANAVWPRKGIDKPHPNDVLYGRGGGTNHHPGNKRYRRMVEERKLRYVKSKRLDKPLIAFEIIRIWRAQDPPGRFLKKEKSTGLWYDVGDAEARKKTSQALREHAPVIRGELETGEGDLEDADDNNNTNNNDGDGGGLEDGTDQEADIKQPPSVTSSSESPGPSNLLSRTESEVPIDTIEDVHIDEECDSSGALFPSLGTLVKDWDDPCEQESAGAQSVTLQDPERFRLPSFGSGRDHSLGEYPLAHASVSQSALDAAFDKTTGAWATAKSPNYFTIAKETSETLAVKLPPSSPSPPSYVDNDDNDNNHCSIPPPLPRHDRLQSEECSAILLNSEEEFALSKPMLSGGVDWVENINYHHNVVCSKDVIKRATSNQNETIETKRHLIGPSVKRVALNRDGTTGKFPLLETTAEVDGGGFASIEDYSAVPPPPSSFCAAAWGDSSYDERSMRELTQTMEKSTLLDDEDPAYFSVPTTVQPKAMSKKDRVTTMDVISMDLIRHPLPMSRTNTAEIIDTMTASADLDDGSAFVHRILSSQDV